MRRVPTIALVLAASALLAPAALATTQTATAGSVTATFTFAGKFPSYKGLHLTIARSGGGVLGCVLGVILIGCAACPGGSCPADRARLD